MISKEVMRDRCSTIVIAMVGKNIAPLWWRGPNKAFDGHTPEDVLEVKPEMVYNYLLSHHQGEW